MLTIIGLLAVQAAAVPPDEIRKTDTKSVVISDVRYRGPDRNYPRPHNFNERGVGYTDDGARLCSAANDMIEDETAPTGWQMEAIIIKAAGIDVARDDEATIKRKTKAWLAREDGRNACTDVHYAFQGDASWMQAMIKPSFDGYDIVDEIILHYGLPLNDVAMRDGRTILDFIADKIDEGQGSSANNYKRIYGTLKRFGAKHRKELELAGALAAPSALQSQTRTGLVATAEAGDLKAMWALTQQYAEEGATEKAAQWLGRSLSSAKASGDSIIMTEIGLRLVDPEGKAKAPFTGRRAEGVALLEAASKYNNPKETFGMMDDRGYALGWAYLKGQGVPTNEALALKHLSAGRAVHGLRLAAQYLLHHGRRAEGIAYLRAVRGPGWQWKFTEGQTIEEWLRGQPEGICGRDILGGDPCK